MRTLADFADVVPSDDLAVYEAAGYGGTRPLGVKPALLVVDTTVAFVGDRPESIAESVKRFPTSCGEDGWRAVRAIERVLKLARGSGVPVFFTRGPDEMDRAHAGGWREKNPRLSDQPPTDIAVGNQFPTPIVPEFDDVIISKDRPSAFFGTPLTSYLIDRRIDTVLIVGGTTSGCVRATCVDAFSLGYRVGVVEEGVFDRGSLSQRVNLFDLGAKYAEILNLQETQHYLAGLAKPSTADVA